MNGKLVLRMAAFSQETAVQRTPGQSWLSRRRCGPQSSEPRRARRSAFTRRSIVPLIPLVPCALALVCLIAATPASADLNDSIPDSGSRPGVSGSIVYPDEATTNTQETSQSNAATTITGPLATQIITEAAAVETLGEQVLSADQAVEDAENALSSVQDRLETAQQTETDLQTKSDSAAAEAYKQAMSLSPALEWLAPDLRDLSIIAPGLEDQPSEKSYLSQLTAAQEETAAAEEAYRTASEVLTTAIATRDELKATFDERSTALAELKAQNATEVALIDAARETYEQSLGSTALGEVNADGMTASAQAVEALAFAFAQLGDPYVWGAEGPNQYDCSGLVWASYRSVGVTLARVASQQYSNGPTVKASKYALGDLLVPGDLVFFSTDPYDWTKIHHVGIYIGSGKMIHAPQTGDVVKISTVTWSELYGAVRIFPAVPATSQTATATATGGSSTTTTPSVSTPSSNATTSATPSSASPSESESSSSSPSPSPSATDSSGVSATPSAPATSGSSS